MADMMDIDPPAPVTAGQGNHQEPYGQVGYSYDDRMFMGAEYGPGDMMMMEEPDYGEMDDMDDDVTSEVSDADSDELELRASTARFDAQQEAFVAQQRADNLTYQPPPPPPSSSSHQVLPSLQTTTTTGAEGPSTSIHQTTPSKPRLPRPRRQRIGPRKAVKPTPDILFRLSVARRSFENRDYEATIQILSEVIRINSETYNAWTLLSTVHEELGDREKATMCLMTAAHLVPKNVPYWISTATYALHGVEDMDESAPERGRALDRAITCYSQALAADKTNIEARTGKADVLMMQGHSSKALAQYNKALGFRPFNIRTVRNMADVALDVKDPRRTAEAAKRAYRRVIDYLMERGDAFYEAEEGCFEWSDLRIYLEFFGILERWGEAARELKSVARWLLGRKAEGVFWDEWLDDDREWDLGDERRGGGQVPGFEPGRYPSESYGASLPVDLRAKLYVYRHKQGNHHEAELHLRLLDPTSPTAVDDFMDFPDCLKDIGNALLEEERAEHAMLYFDLFKQIANMTGDMAVDADVLVSQGRCHLALGDKSAAEECFIAAIETDEDHIEARVQLANMYEGEQQQEGREEAFLLVSQALNLEARRGADGETVLAKPRKRRGPYGPRKPREKKDDGPRKPAGEKAKSKYVPRRLINAEKRKQHDLQMTEVATKNYQVMQELKDQVVAGSDEQTQAAWMRAARDLVDDFRSYKEFYPWEKYIKYLGYGGNVQGQAAAPARNLRLAAMAERLQQNLAPTVEGQQQDPAAGAAPAAKVVAAPKAHRGIPFDKWLDIFLDYAFCLVRAGQHREAYVVCHAARDSIIWTAMDATYLIHLAWASCAVYAGDEETCVAIARYFMRDYMPGTDSYRMFSAMCRVCQTPVSWYTSGPAQKFILRQIKTMDNIMMRKLRRDSGEGGGGGAERGERRKAAAAVVKGDGEMNYRSIDEGEFGGATQTQSISGSQTEQDNNSNNNGTDVVAANTTTTTNIDSDNNDDGIGLDVCLLTIYGHILFTTTSYTYALSYLARAASIDPHNCLINLSMGLAYLHYALKRQATNRQYLLTQAFAFLFRYYRDRLDPREEEVVTVAQAKTITNGDGDGGGGGSGEGEEMVVKKVVKKKKVSRAQRQEAHFNIARAYALIGLGNLANEYYLKVLKEEEEEDYDDDDEGGGKGVEDVADEGEKKDQGKWRSGGMGNEDLTIEAAYNIRTMCFLLGDFEGARAVAEKWLVL